MNETEKKAYKWLLHQGYMENDIIYQKNKSPDFVCSDGKKFEIKRLYSHTVLFTEQQIKELSFQDVTILVFSDENDKPVLIFPSSKINDRLTVNDIKIAIIKYESKRSIVLKVDTYNRLEKFLIELMERIGHRLTFDDAVNALLNEHYNKSDIKRTEKEQSLTLEWIDK